MLKLHEFTENINKTGFSGSILEHEDMGSRTTMKAGGKAELFIIPKNVESLFMAIKTSVDSSIPFFILGGGSNVIPPDGELEAAVISTEAFDSIQILDNGDNEFSLVRCGAGVKTDDLVNFCTENGMGGLESFAGLPGTVGGAAFMNARCYGKEMADVIDSAEFIDLDGIDRIQENAENYHNFIERHLKMYHNGQSGADWAYKKSPFMQNHGIVTSLVFRARKADIDQREPIRLECEKYILDRKEKGHFKAPSAGSVFKNDRNFGEPSGRIIDSAGLKGAKSGGAQIAPWHGNIIINCGNAKSADIKALVAIVQETVKKKTGFQLEPEIIFAEQNLHYK